MRRGFTALWLRVDKNICIHDSTSFLFYNSHHPIVALLRRSDLPWDGGSLDVPGRQNKRVFSGPGVTVLPSTARGNSSVSVRTHG